MTDNTRKSAPRDALSYNRRDLLRRAGYFGVGAVGFGIVGCKNRPDDEIADLSTTPQVLQNGGTVSARISGLLGGAAGAGVMMRIKGIGTAEANDQGAIDVRVEENGDYDVVFEGKDFFTRNSRIRVAGNVSVAVTLLETDEGLSMSYVNQYARGRGAGKGVDIDPRTPGYSNRWNSPPTYRIYRKLEDSNKERVSDARVDAMRASILGLFPSLTASRLGIPGIEVRDEVPPSSLGEVPNGVVVVAQRKSTARTLQTDGSFNSIYVLSKAHIGCAFDSTIELFNRMVGHSTGAYGVGSGAGSIMSGPGAAAPSDRDLQAAQFLYSRVAGNRAEDRDLDDVFLN